MSPEITSKWRWLPLESKGATPTKASIPQYTYEFAGWDPEITTVSGDTTYTATYTPIERYYTVKYVDEDGTTPI